MLYAKPTSKVITRPNLTVINQSVPSGVRSTTNVMLTYLRALYKYRLNFDLVNDPYGTGHGSDFAGEAILLTALDDNSAAAVAAGDVRFFIGVEPLLLDTPTPITLAKGSATSAAVEVEAVNIGDGVGEYEEGYLRYKLTSVSPIVPAEMIPVFGTCVFGRTAFSQGPIMKEVGDPVELVRLNLGKKNVIGFGSHIMFNFFVMSGNAQTLYSEFFDFEEDN